MKLYCPFDHSLNKPLNISAGVFPVLTSLAESASVNKYFLYALPDIAVCYQPVFT